MCYVSRRTECEHTLQSGLCIEENKTTTMTMIIKMAISMITIFYSNNNNMYRWTIRKFQIVSSLMMMMMSGSSKDGGGAVLVMKAARHQSQTLHVVTSQSGREDERGDGGRGWRARSNGAWQRYPAHRRTILLLFSFTHTISLTGSLTINPFTNRLLAFHRETTVPAYYTLKINPCLCLFVCLSVDWHRHYPTCFNLI